MHSILTLSTLALFTKLILANTEKVIFLGPPAIALSASQPRLEKLRLETLSHSSNSTLRRNISVTFPSEVAPRGIDHWYLLQNLVAGQRYEVRVCWAATQPTEFWLNTYSISEAFEAPALISSLAEYSGTRQHLPKSDRELQTQRADSKETSLLFLHIQAAADFFSTNATLMRDPPNVIVDIILDPFILNVLPQSLAPIGLHIIVVAVIAWFVSGVVYKWLAGVARADLDKQHEE